MKTQDQQTIKNIRTVIGVKGLTLKEFCERMNFSSPITVSRYFNNKANRQSAINDFIRKSSLVLQIGMLELQNFHMNDLILGNDSEKTLRDYSLLNDKCKQLEETIDLYRFKVKALEIEVKTIKALNQL